MPNQLQEFFGVQFAPAGPIWESVDDTYFTCALCGALCEFTGVVLHAKYHKWETFVAEKNDGRLDRIEAEMEERRLLVLEESARREERIAELENIVGDLTAGEVIPMQKKNAD